MLTAGLLVPTVVLPAWSPIGPRLPTWFLPSLSSVVEAGHEPARPEGPTSARPVEIHGRPVPAGRVRGRRRSAGDRRGRSITLDHDADRPGGSAHTGRGARIARLGLIRRDRLIDTTGLDERRRRLRLLHDPREGDVARVPAVEAERPDRGTDGRAGWIVDRVGRLHGLGEPRLTMRPRRHMVRRSDLDLLTGLER